MEAVKQVLGNIQAMLAGLTVEHIAYAAIAMLALSGAIYGTLRDWSDYH